MEAFTLLKDEVGEQLANEPGLFENHITQIEFFLTRAFHGIYYLGNKRERDIQSQISVNNLFAQLLQPGGGPNERRVKDVIFCIKKYKQ